MIGRSQEAQISDNQLGWGGLAYVSKNQLETDTVLHFVQISKNDFICTAVYNENHLVIRIFC